MYRHLHETIDNHGKGKSVKLFCELALIAYVCIESSRHLSLLYRIISLSEHKSINKIYNYYTEH